MKRMQISNNIEYIQPDNENARSCSAGLIVSSSPSIYIDTHMGAKSQKAFLVAEKPDIAVASHYHSDHSAWLKAAQELCGSQVFVPEGEEECFRKLDFYIEQSVGESEKAMRKTWQTVTRDIAGYQKIDDFDLHWHGKVFRSGDTTVECIKCPGHSPSHTCFYLPEEKVLYTSDMGIGHPGPFYGASDCDLKDFVSSVLMLRGIEAKALLTSHSGPVTSGIESAWNRCLHQFLVLERFIQKKLDQGKERSDIVDALINFANISRTRKPFAKLITMWASISFDHHHDVLMEGGLLKIFPELKKIDRSVSRNAHP